MGILMSSVPRGDDDRQFFGLLPAASLYAARFNILCLLHVAGVRRKSHKPPSGKPAPDFAKSPPPPIR